MSADAVLANYISAVTMTSLIPVQCRCIFTVLASRLLIFSRWLQDCFTFQKCQLCEMHVLPRRHYHETSWYKDEQWSLRNAVGLFVFQFGDGEKLW